MALARVVAVVVGFLAVVAVFAVWQATMGRREPVAEPSATVPASVALPVSAAASAGPTLPEVAPSASASAVAETPPEASASAAASAAPPDLAPEAVASPFAAAIATDEVEGEGEALIVRAERELDRGRAKNAAAYAYKYTQQFPNKAFGWLMLGASLQQMGNMPLAKEAYRTCVEQGKGRGLDDCRAMGGGAKR
jgi:cytoskeletal protein RodZ